MPSKIALGYEDTEYGRDALALAVLLARTTGAHLTAVSVYPYEPPIRVGGDEVQAELRAEAEHALTRVHDLVPTEVRGRVETRAIPSPPVGGGLRPAHALHDFAEAEAVDLLVVGSCHRGRVGRVLLGSVGERLLQGATCAVAVAPVGFASVDAPALKTIGVAYDEQAVSAAALREAAALATRAGAHLRVISVNEPVDFSGLAASPTLLYSEAELHQAVEEVLQRAVASLPRGLSVEGVVRDGNAAEVLVKEARRGLDLLVMGSRVYGPIGRVLLGGVSNRVIRSAACPVEVVPIPARIEARDEDAALAEAGT